MVDEARSTSFTSQNSLVNQLSIVNQLSRLVDTQRDNSTATQQRAVATDHKEESVGTAITRLFPSVNGGSRRSTSSNIHDSSNLDQNQSSNHHGFS